MKKEFYDCKFSLVKKIFYLCIIILHLMRKEIGKWFMDVAKYVATAVLISSFWEVLNINGLCT